MGTLPVNAIDQSGRRDSVRISYMTEDTVGHVDQKVVDFARKAGVAIAQEGNSVCHRLLTRKPVPEATSFLFVRQPKKHKIMTDTKKKGSQEKFYIIDDVTPLWNKLF